VFFEEEKKMRKLTKLLYDENGKGKKVIVKERFFVSMEWIMLWLFIALRVRE